MKDPRDLLNIVVILATIISSAWFTRRCIISKKLHKHIGIESAIAFIVIILFSIAITYANFGVRKPLLQWQAIGRQYEEDGDYEKALDIYMDIFNQRGDWGTILEDIKRVKQYVKYDDITVTERGSNCMIITGHNDYRPYDYTVEELPNGDIAITVIFDKAG